MVLAVSSIVSTSLTGGVVFAIMVLAVRSIWKKKKSGGGCGCGCAGCSGACPSKKRDS